jgi:hypothetical protein
MIIYQDTLLRLLGIFLLDLREQIPEMELIVQ